MCNFYCIQLSACLFPEVSDHFFLNIEDGYRGLLARFHAWLMVSVNINETGVKTNSAFKERDELAYSLGCDLPDRDSDRLATIIIERVAGSEEEAL